MYNDFFSLEHPPFRITPDTGLFYSGAKRGAVLDALVYAVHNGEGIIKVVGEVGSGKTMLCRMLEVRLPRNIEIVYIANPSLSPENILQVIAFELKLVVDPQVSKLESMQKLQALLTRRHAEGKQVVVFIEEAQSMPLATLEEVRLLSNLETEQSKLMQVVLFGQPELDENLSDSSIRQLRERITHSFDLEPLQAEEVLEYLNYRMWVSGYRGADIFDTAIARLIAAYSHGMIRRINILADKTLLAAYAENTRSLRKQHVLNAARDSQFVAIKPLQKNRLVLAACALLIGVAAGAATFGVLYWSNSGDREAVAVSNATLADTKPSADAVIVAEDIRKPAAQMPAQSDASEVTHVTPTGEGVAKPGDRSIHYDGRLRDWLATTRDRITQISDAGFCIQLLTVGLESANKLSDYLEKLPSDIELDKVYVYETEIRGSIKLAVIYNQYSSRDSAWQAISALPAQLQRWQPFVRKVRNVKTEITG